MNLLENLNVKNHKIVRVLFIGRGPKIFKSSTPEELAERRKGAKSRRGPRIARDGWLAPLALNPRVTGPAVNKDGVRASDKGFLDMSLEDYIALLYWTGSRGKRKYESALFDRYWIQRVKSLCLRGIRLLMCRGATDNSFSVASGQGNRTLAA